MAGGGSVISARASLPRVLDGPKDVASCIVRWSSAVGLPKLVEALPPTQLPSTGMGIGIQAPAATGLDGESTTPEVSGLRAACAVGDVGCDSVRSVESPQTTPSPEHDRPEVLPMQREESDCDRMSPVDGKRPLPDSNRGMA